MIKIRRKVHFIKSTNYGDTAFYPTYCGLFVRFEMCTRKPELITCSRCKKKVIHHEH